MDKVDLETLRLSLDEDCWCKMQIFVSKYPSKSTVTQCNDSLGTEELDYTRQFLNVVSLPLIFVALDYSFSEECTKENRDIYANISKNTISKVVGSSLGPSLVLEHGNFLLAGLGHQNIELRKIILQLLKVLLTGSCGDQSYDQRVAVLAPFFSQQPMTALLSWNMTSDQVSLCSLATEILLLVSEVCLEPVTLALVAGANEESVAANSTIKLRFGEAIARLAGKSDAAFSACLHYQALEIVLGPLLPNQEGEDPDILVQLAALDLLPFISESRAGLVYLFKEGIVQTLLDFSLGNPSLGVSADPILGSNALSVITLLYGRACKVLKNDALFWEEVGNSTLILSFLHASLSHLDSQNEGARVSAMDAVSSFAMVSSEALKLILESSAILNAWLRLYGMKVEMKAACLHSLARVLLPLSEDRAKVMLEGGCQSEHDEPCDVEGVPPEEDALKQQLFTKFGVINEANSAIELLLDFVRTPVEELRYGAYDVLRAVVGQTGHWGLLAVLGDPRLVAIFKNRSTESNKLGKEWKFSVIEMGMKHKQKHLLGTEATSDFLKILNAGPFVDEKKLGEMQTLP